VKTWHGYRLYVIDGSQIRIPDESYIVDAFGINLESAVERPVECVGFCDWRGAMRSNSLPIATIRNAARRKRQRAIQVVATHPAGKLSKTIKQDVDQNVNTSSKRSTAESRINLGKENQKDCPLRNGN